MEQKKSRDISMMAKYVGLSLLTKNMSVSPLKLQKILYYVQAWYMVFFDEKLVFEDVPQAWVNGPVYPTIYSEYRGKAANMCDHLKASAFIDGADVDTVDAFHKISEDLHFSKEEVELIESVILLYGRKTQNDLIFLTHAEKPWAEARKGLEPYERSSKELSLETMFNYYSERHNRNRQS